MKLMTMLVAGLLTGCSTTPPKPNPEREAAARMVAEAQERGREVAQRMKVNDNWSVNCTEDHVTKSRRCFAGTFGSPMGSDGMPRSTEKMAPFQVVYYDGKGPFLMVGANTYPGRTPTVRLDDGEPRQVDERQPQAQLVTDLRSARVVRARFHQWPSGAKDMVVAVDGVAEALDRLDQQRQR